MKLRIFPHRSCIANPFLDVTGPDTKSSTLVVNAVRGELNAQLHVVANASAQMRWMKPKNCAHFARFVRLDISTGHAHLSLRL